jgi:hypothetical protein
LAGELTSKQFIMLNQDLVLIDLAEGLETSMICVIVLGAFLNLNVLFAFDMFFSLEFDPLIFPHVHLHLYLHVKIPVHLIQW